MTIDIDPECPDDAQTISEIGGQLRLKVLLYADFRSPHAIGWKEGLLAAGLEVLAVSSEPVSASDIISPTDSTSAVRESVVSKRGSGWMSDFIQRLSRIQVLHSLLQLVRHRSRCATLRSAIEDFNPDLVHALRLPYEGVTALASVKNASVPVVVSSWGQDFVPQASGDPLLRFWLRRHLKKAAGYHFDSETDVERAFGYGLRTDIPRLHAAGNFGVDTATYKASRKVPGLVVYARKAVPSCNYFGFIEAAISLLETTDAKFVGVGLERVKAEATRRFGDFDSERISLVGELPGDSFAGLISSANVIVSPAYTDGMPVTILGAVASGTHIVAGDLPQLRDLRESGASIELVDASSARDIARGISMQLQNRSAPRTSIPAAYSRQANASRVPDFYAETLEQIRLR